MRFAGAGYFAAVILVGMTGCGRRADTLPDRYVEPAADAAGEHDAGRADDAEVERDATTTADAMTPVATASDASLPDGGADGSEPDAGPLVDAGAVPDAGMPPPQMCRTSGPCVSNDECCEFCHDFDHCH
jgi:hypothetical protein